MYSLYEKTQGENSMTLEQQITAEEVFYFDDFLSSDEIYDIECSKADEFNDDIFLEASNV
jgi:hypothetical protein